MDEENIKWIANSGTLYKVEAKNQATEVPLAGSEVSLLQFPGGNADIRWSREVLQGLLGNAEITAAAYDKSKKVLWIGTNGYGVFKFQVNPSLKLIEQLHIDNSKLRSDFINSVYVSSNGKVWIATEDGAAVVDGNQWTVEQKYFNILRIRGRGDELWAIGDDLIWLIDRKENWTPIAINRREIEGQIHDIALDDDGRVWIASNIMTAYRVDTDRYKRFGPGQYFTSQFVNYVAEDDDATIWVGTDDKGLYIIEKESTITVTSEIEKYIDCNDPGDNAVVSLQAVGGKPPYEFYWEDGIASDNREGLGSGLYSLTVTDTEGSTKAETIEIPDPTITLLARMDRPESGIGMQDGAATVEVSGGVEPYTFEWFSGQGERIMTGLAEGEYGITVTDAAGCSQITTVVISQIVQPLTLGLDQRQFINCPGDATAIVVATPVGGKPPFSYQWSHGQDTLEFADALPAGLYTATVSDSEGNSATSEIRIAEPEQLVASVIIDSPASANADDGAATVQCTGGNPPYEYAWDNGEIAQKAIALSSRRHTVTVTDDSGCTTEAAVDISENILPLSVEIDQTGEIVCAGDSSVSVSLTTSGGKSPFTYQWNKPGFSGIELDNIGAGEYAVTVTDAVGSTAVGAISIKGPKPIQATTLAEAPALSGTNEGHAVVRADGGTGKLTYSWDNGDGGQRTEALSAGVHTVTITDQVGCTAVAEVEILENVLPLNAVFEQTGVILCAGESTGALSVTPAGGKAPYSYLWSTGEQSGSTVSNLPAGTYSVTVTDGEGTSTVVSSIIEEPDPITTTVTAEAPAMSGENNGEASIKALGGVGRLSYSWDNGCQKAKAEELTPGLHQVTVSDENGCSVVAEVTISEDFLPLALTLEQESQVLCHNDSTGVIVANVTGGKEPYTFGWSNGIGSGSSVSNLQADTYSVTVTDAEGSSTAMSLIIEEPDPITFTVIAEAPAISGESNGEASIKAGGGTGRLSFNWDSGGQGTRAEALSPGLHQVTVMDENGCSVVAEVTISEDFLPLALTLEQEGQILCHNESTGIILANVTGGKEPYTYEWSGGIESGNLRPSGLKAGTYSLTITDVNGNSIQDDISLVHPDPLVLASEVLSAASANTSDGRAKTVVTGGVTPYAYAWSSGASTPEVSEIPAGRYQVTVTDANGCSATSEVNITEDILELKVAIEQTGNIACHGEAGAALEVQVSGGKSPFEYSWNDQATGQSRGGLSAGEYSVEVTDEAGQLVRASIVVEEPAPLTGEITEVRAATHERVKDGRATARITGGVTPYKFNWDNGESGGKASQLSVGPHAVTVTDAMGCSITLQATISEKILPELTAENLERGEAVRMEKLQFEADSSAINQESIPTLEELYQFLYDNPTIVVEVGGHTNGLPEHDYCDRLSTERAKAVAGYIINKGIDEKRVLYRGYGKRQPIATNMTPDGRRRNQRVEVKIVKLTE